MILIRTVRMGRGCMYSDADLYCTLYMLSRNSSVGRRKICRELDLGDGSIKGLLSLMRDQELITTSKEGSSITPYGLELVDRIGIIPVSINVGRFVIGQHQNGALIRGGARQISNGTEQRDLAIRSGGEGCTTWVVRDGRMFMAPDMDMEELSPGFSKTVLESVDAEDGDALVVCSAENESMARLISIDVALNTL